MFLPIGVSALSLGSVCRTLGIDPTRDADRLFRAGSIIHTLAIVARLLDKHCILSPTELSRNPTIRSMLTISGLIASTELNHATGAGLTVLEAFDAPLLLATGNLNQWMLFNYSAKSKELSAFFEQQGMLIK